jgi:exosome complex component RRP4
LCRYVGEIGDLVVARISSVESKRWKADINASKDAVLQLASVNLPGGMQRMRTYEDQLQMRSLFEENDLVSAEIQNISTDGTLSLHTRSLRYGKLENGQLIMVPASLMKRLPQHNITLPWGVDVILGRNGYIWITRSIPEDWKIEMDKGAQGQAADNATPLAETLQLLRTKHANTPILSDERLKIARVRNSIEILRLSESQISSESIITVYRKSEELGLAPKDMLRPDAILNLSQN